MSVRLRLIGDVLLWTRNNKMPFDLVQHEPSRKTCSSGTLRRFSPRAVTRAGKRWLNTNPPEAGVYFRDAGFDILSVANNHTLDLGREGFEKTLAVLESHGIAYIGGARGDDPPQGLVVERNGVTTRVPRLHEWYVPVATGGHGIQTEGEGGSSTILRH